MIIKIGEKHQLNRISSEGGGAILTSMMYTAVVMFIVISLLDFLNLRSHDRAASKLSMQRNQLMYWVRHEVRVGLNIYASIGLPENAELKKCVVYDAAAGDPFNQCISINNTSSALRGVTYISDKLVPITGSSKSTMVKYTADGTLCSAAMTCVFGIWTEFVATCPNLGWWSCDTAKALLVSIHIVPLAVTTSIAERVEVQYVAIQDWGEGQWSLVAYDSDITVPDSDKTPVPTPTPTPTPDPGAAMPGAGSSVSPTPTPTPATVPGVPTPPPVAPKASCGQGMAPVGNSCEKFSI